MFEAFKHLRSITFDQRKLVFVNGGKVRLEVHHHLCKKPSFSIKILIDLFIDSLQSQGIGLLCVSFEREDLDEFLDLLGG